MRAERRHIFSWIMLRSCMSATCNGVIAVTKTMACKIPSAPRPMPLPPGTPPAGSSFCAQFPTKSAIIEPMIIIIMKVIRFGIQSHMLWRASDNCVN